MSQQRNARALEVPLLESSGYPTNAQSGERTVEHVESCAVVERNNSAAHVVAATKCALKFHCHFGDELVALFPVKKSQKSQKSQKSRVKKTSPSSLQTPPDRHSRTPHRRYSFPCHLPRPTLGRLRLPALMTTLPAGALGHGKNARNTNSATTVIPPDEVSESK